MPFCNTTRELRGANQKHSHPYKLKEININAGNVNHMHAPCRSYRNQPKKLDYSSLRLCWTNQPRTPKEKEEP